MQNGTLLKQLGHTRSNSLKLVLQKGHGVIISFFSDLTGFLARFSIFFLNFGLIEFLYSGLQIIAAHLNAVAFSPALLA